MQIREPKFKVGEKVYCEEFKCNAIITGISDYSFANDEYYYSLRYDDGDNEEMIESMLRPYQEPPKTVWDLKEGEECYWLTLTGHIYNGIWDGSGLSIGIRDTGGCFLTRKEAECDIERRKVETEMLHLGGRREFKNGENNHYIVCDFDSSHFAIRIFNNKSDGFAPMTIYFDSAKECRNAIEKIGEDRIKKYIFGVEE